MIFVTIAVKRLIILLYLNYYGFPPAWQPFAYQLNQGSRQWQAEFTAEHNFSAVWQSVPPAQHELGWPPAACKICTRLSASWPQLLRRLAASPALLEPGWPPAACNICTHTFWRLAASPTPAQLEPEWPPATWQNFHPAGRQPNKTYLTFGSQSRATWTTVATSRKQNLHPAGRQPKTTWGTFGSQSRATWSRVAASRKQTPARYPWCLRLAATRFRLYATGCIRQKWYATLCDWQPYGC